VQVTVGALKALDDVGMGSLRHMVVFRKPSPWQDKPPPGEDMT
jgi:hypothetical protein